MDALFLRTIRAVVSAYPAVMPYLDGKALYAAKTYDFFLSTVTNLIESVYEGSLGGEFTNIMRNLILGQISQAYEQAWLDDGNDLPPPEYLRDASQAAVLAQYEHVDGLYRDIVDAKIDKTPLAPLLAPPPAPKTLAAARAAPPATPWAAAALK